MTVELVQVTTENVDDIGFFCKKSKRASDGWKAKRAWSDTAMGDGLQTWLALDGKRQVGFIEFVPAEASWRVIDAPGHLVVHCVWVVGRAKDQGVGGRLLQLAIDEAAARGLGIAALATTKKGWLVGPKLLANKGFEKVDTAAPSFELWAITPKNHPRPTLPTDWDERAAAFGDGLTLVYTNQCPYVDHMRSVYAQTAERHGLVYKEVFLDSAAAVRERAPAPFGVFSVVRDGKLLTWRYEAEKVLDRRIGATSAGGSPSRR